MVQQRWGAVEKEKYTASPQDGVSEFIASEWREAMEEQLFLTAPAGARVTSGVGIRTIRSHLAVAMNAGHSGSRSHE